MTKIKVDKDIKEALDGLIYKGDVSISLATRQERIEGIIRHYAKYESWSGYKQLNRLSLLELIGLLTKGYESIPTHEEKLVENYLSHNKTVNYYKDKKSLDKNELSQEAFSRGYVTAFENLLAKNIDISKIKITDN